MMSSPSPSRPQLGRLAPRRCGSWAAKIRIASAFTKPVRTELETNRISMPILHRPKTICMAPASNPAANRYWMPCVATSGAATSATEPAAADTMAGRPPQNAITMLMTNDANSPTEGSTPATNEKAITSGISANVATAPASNSRGILGAHCARRRASKDKDMVNHPAKTSGSPRTGSPPRRHGTQGQPATRCATPHAGMHTGRSRHTQYAIYSTLR